MKIIIIHSAWVALVLTSLQLAEFRYLYRWYSAGTVLSIISVVILIAGILMAIKQVKSQGRSSTFTALCVGIVISFVVAVFVAFFCYGYANLFDKDLVVRLVAAEQKALQEQGESEHDIMLANKATYVTYESPLLLVGTFLSTFVPGLLASVFMALLWVRRAKHAGEQLPPPDRPPGGR